MFENLAPQLYYPAFLGVMTIVILVHFAKIYSMGTEKLLYSKKGNLFVAVLLTLFLVFFIGLRPVSGRYFGDMGSYAWMFRLYEAGMEDPTSSQDALFTLIIKFFARFSTMKMFFLFMEILYIVPIFLACRRLSKENNYTILLFAFSAMSFFTYGTNGIRNGAATSLFLLAVTFLNGKPAEKLVFVVISFLAYQMHASVAIPIVAAVGAYIVKNPKFMFYVWGVVLLLSIFQSGVLTAIISFAGMESRLASYLEGPGNVEDHLVKTGFRWDFLLYSFMPIVLGWWVVFRKKIYTRTYAILLGTYIYANVFWLMVIRAPYSNRFAYLSWFLYPVVLAYPMLAMPVWKKTPGLKTGIILLGHIAFTLLMAFRGGDI